jgi:hypothetical protein
VALLAPALALTYEGERFYGVIGGTFSGAAAAYIGLW